MWLRVADARRSCAIAVHIVILKNVQCVDSTGAGNAAKPCSRPNLVPPNQAVQNIIRTVCVRCARNFVAERIIPGHKSHAAESDVRAVPDENFAEHLLRSG